MNTKSIALSLFTLLLSQSLFAGNQVLYSAVIGKTCECVDYPAIKSATTEDTGYEKPRKVVMIPLDKVGDYCFMRKDGEVQNVYCDSDPYTDLSGMKVCPQVCVNLTEQKALTGTQKDEEHLKKSQELRSKYDLFLKDYSSESSLKLLPENSTPLVWGYSNYPNYLLKYDEPLQAYGIREVLVDGKIRKVLWLAFQDKAEKLKASVLFFEAMAGKKLLPLGLLTLDELASAEKNASIRSLSFKTPVYWVNNHFETHWELRATNPSHTHSLHRLNLNELFFQKTPSPGSKLNAYLVDPLATISERIDCTVWGPREGKELGFKRIEKGTLLKVMPHVDSKNEGIAKEELIAFTVDLSAQSIEFKEWYLKPEEITNWLQPLSSKTKPQEILSGMIKGLDGWLGVCYEGKTSFVQKKRYK